MNIIKKLVNIQINIIKIFKNNVLFNLFNYMLSIIENKKKKKIQNLNINNKNMHLKQNLNTIKQNNQKIKSDKEVQNEIDAHTIKKTKNNNQVLINSIKFRETKNFLVINKRNVKNIEKVNQCKSINHKLENKIKSNCSIKEVIFYDILMIYLIYIIFYFFFNLIKF